MFIGCKLPAGLIVEHNGQKIALNGTNVGFDADSPWKNGSEPDSLDRVSGVGITELKGDEAAAMKDWIAVSGKGEGPVRNGLIFVVDSKGDATKEAQALEGKKAAGGINPDKDLPKELSTDTDKKG